MLLVYVLSLFLLLGTFVDAFPVNVNGHRSPLSISNAHKLGHHLSLEHLPEEQGDEVSFRPVITHDNPLWLTDIEMHAGLWYREPTSNADYNNRHDIIEILVEGNLIQVTGGVQAQGRHMGVIVFHEMGKMPGEVIKHHHPYIYLTAANRERLVGTWSRMPSAGLPIPLRGDKMVVILEHERLHYSVEAHHVTMRSAITETGSSTLVSVFPGNCMGTWVRELTEDTYQNYAHDVIVTMSQGSTTIHTMGRKPGQILKEEQPFFPKRPVGTWYRMPDASTDVNRRLDRMVVNYEEGQLVHKIHQTPVEMKGSPTAIRTHG